MTRSLSARHMARVLALQGLYEHMVSDNELEQIEEHLLDQVTSSQSIRENLKIELKPGQTLDVDQHYFKKILSGVKENLELLNQALVPFLDRKIESVNTLELCMIRLGAFELMFCKDVPFRVILNEGILIAKKFGAQDSHRFVNGVLDKLAKQQREGEIDLNKKQK